MTQRLDESGHLVYEKYRGINLTPEGLIIAKNITQRHDLLVKFLIAIGVNEKIANLDAEGREHHLHVETVKKLEQFLRKKDGKER